MPQKMIARWAVAKVRATVRSVSASMPQTAAISSGGNWREMLLQLLEALGVRPGRTGVS